MSKWKKLYLLLVVLFTICMDLYVITYQTKYATQMVNVEITLDSSIDNNIQLFYTNETNKTDFAENNSITKKINAGQNQKVVFSISCDTKAIRVDFGEQKNETKIKQFDFAYKNITKNMPAEDLTHFVKYNDIQNCTIQDGSVVLDNNAGDPYLVLDISNYHPDEMVAAAERPTDIAKKVFYVLAITVVGIFLIRKRNKILSNFKKITDNHEMIKSLSLNDFKTQFAGSYLGIVWALVQPIVTVVVYWFVFQIGLRNGNLVTKNGTVIPFVLWLMAGLVPWFYFQDAIMGGTSCLLSYSYLVKKVVFNIDILPIVKVLSSIFVHLFFVIFMLCIYALYGFFPDLYTLQIIYYSFCMLLLVLGIVYLTSAVVVFFRDLSQIINIILQIQTWMTPIMWNIDGINLPGLVKVILKINPMFYIVNGYRDALINKVYFWDRLDLTLYYWACVLVFFVIGTNVFRRLKIHFADVL